MKLVFLSVLIVASSSAQADFQSKVIAVSDGDTVKVLTGDNRQIKVRLENIDAPEKNQPYGTQAKKFTSDLIFGKSVTVKEKNIDRYGRTIGTIFFNGQNINKKIVSSGYAWAYRQYLDDSSYLQLEADARRNKRGLWRDNSPVEPYKWRKK